LDIIDNLHVVTTNDSNTTAYFHTLEINAAHVKLFPACSAFTIHFLVTASNNDYSSASVLKSSLNGGSLPIDYDWWFTANQFVLATSPLRLTTSNFILN
jgi:hypothetical protein